MSDINKIVWSEGMFIAPQHFQHLELTMTSYADELAQIDIQGNDCGFSVLEINEEQLKVGKLSVRHAAGILPDRTFFQLAQELILDCPDGTVDSKVFFGVPLARRGAIQVGDTRGVHRLLSEQKTLHDISNSENEPLETETASFGACLLLEGADLSGFSVLPLGRILEKTMEGKIVFDKSFIPPCLSLVASDILVDRLDDVLSLARARATNTAGRIEVAMQTQSTSSFLDEKLELQILNKAIFTLQNVAMHPYISSRRLHSLLGELTVSLNANDAKTTDQSFVYDPSDVGKSFALVFSQLRRQLTLQTKSSVLALPWNDELFGKRRLLRLVIQPRLLSEDRRPILSVSGPEGAASLSEIVPSACKLAGISAMPELVKRGLPGVALKSLGNAPSELRDKADAAFFAIDTGSIHWQSFVEKKEALAIHVDDRIHTMTATLYMLG
ncbi:MAG: type VI secretion system baseplate subunit TssK [Planktomarina sp.]|nr:type VI secretion system baseplate subunit TssK [Planktomarina sp.]